VSTPGRAPDATHRANLQARLMLAVLCFVWGVTWPVMRIALNEMPPLTMRALTAALGALTLYLICRVRGHSLRIATAKDWGHVIVASLFNIAGFSLFSAYAQLAAETSRVTVLAYTMPIWSVFLAWPFLGEKPNRTQSVALALCVLGLAVLIYPLADRGIPLGIVLALATGVSWAIGTVYLKWARIKADAMGVASWQLTVAFVVLATCMFAAEGPPDLTRMHADGLAAVVWTGVFGNGVAYALWFTVVRRLPAVTASIGVLGSPVIGVVFSVLMLREVPTVPDIVGFTLIFSASACVLLGRAPRPVAVKP